MCGCVCVCVCECVCVCVCVFLLRVRSPARSLTDSLACPWLFGGNLHLKQNLCSPENDAAHAEQTNTHVLGVSFFRRMRYRVCEKNQRLLKHVDANRYFTVKCLIFCKRKPYENLHLRTKNRKNTHDTKPHRAKTKTTLVPKPTTDTYMYIKVSMVL